MTREPIHVVKRPLITEKSAWESDSRNRFSFEVAADARKPEIKQAIEQLYGVRVKSVATQLRKGKHFRTRFGYAKKADWKRATVLLHDEDTIELF
jgi:large subunit ribosomal protein L23